MRIQALIFRWKTVSATNAVSSVCLSVSFVFPIEVRSFQHRTIICPLPSSPSNTWSDLINNFDTATPLPRLRKIKETSAREEQAGRAEKGKENKQKENQVKEREKTGEGAMGAALLRTLRQRKTYKMLQLLVTWRQWLVLFNWQQCWLLHWGFETGNVTYGGCNGRRKLCPMRHPHGYFKNPSRPGLSSGCGLPDRTLSVLSLRI